MGYPTTDLHALPEDGRRYELIDGSLIVSPSATIHQNIIALWIAGLLWDANPGDDFVVGTDQSTTIDHHNEPRPDIVLVPEQDEPTIALAELVLDESGGQYRYATHYTTEAFETRRPWPVRIDLPGLTARRAKLMRRA